MQSKFLNQSFKVSILVLSLVFFGCNEDDGVEAPRHKKLNESTELFNWSKSEIELIVIAGGFGELKDYLKYDVQVYSITYKTDYRGQEIIASGIVGFPQTETAVPMLSFQHGTIVKHADAPSQNGSSYRPLASVASAGYIFLIPDFIGFGSSTQFLHPYYHQGLTASSVMDMMIAVKELSEQEGYNFNGEAFLAGYSEGGYATMVTHKAIEDEGMEDFNLIASAPASGGYDVKGMQEYFFSLDTYSEPYYLPYVALAYNETYDWGQPMTDFFQEPYATEIPAYYDGSLSGSQINSKLTTSITDLVTPEFYTEINTDPKYADINEALKENSIVSWVPRAPVFMYHGTDDTTVPYQNSVVTYESMINAGASTDVVQFIPLEGEDHGSGFEPYILDLVAKFDALK